MSHADIPANEPISAPALANWARAMNHIAAHYRIACSPGALQASAPWFKDKPMTQALTQLARQAGLSFQPLTPTEQSLSRWKLPVVIQLQDGDLVLVEQFDGDNQLDVCFVNGELQRNRITLSELLPTIRFIIALRPISAMKDSRVDAYVSRFRADWLKSLVLKDLRPYGPVMLAALLMILPGLLLQKKLAELANQSAHEATLRNAVLVESVQGLEDIKLMQAENRFLQQWNSYIRITAESGLRTRELSQGLINWGVTVQGLVYAAVVMFGAPLVIEGTLTTGSVVAASMLASRMIAPMGNLCGVLARWQQVKAAKKGLDSIMELPVETQRDETLFIV